MSFENSDFELDSSSTLLKSSITEPKENMSNTNNCEFIPIDWETGIEEAINEPLPNVIPDDETEKQSNTLLMVNDLNIKQIPEILIHDSEHKKVQYEESQNHSVMESFIEKFNADLDLGTDSLPSTTPIKSSTFDKENFLNPQKKVNLNSIRNRHILPSRIKTPRVDVSNEQYVTPRVKQTQNLLRHIEPCSSSKLPIRKPTNHKFTNLKVNSIEYTVLKALGRGGSSVVYQCFNCDSMENRAVKCVSLDSPLSHQGYLKEIDVLKKLQGCDRIIKMFDFEISTKEKKLYVVLEMGSADLAEILKDLSVSDGVVPFYLVLFYWMEMLYAVQQIHHHGIIHSDLKPANFLQISGRLKLIDFGISSCLYNDSTSVIKTVSEGSSSYISPEALNCEYSNNKYSPNYGKPKYRISYKSDVWSLGCILYQLIYKKTPFSYISNQMQKLMAIVNDSVEIKYPQDDKIPEKFIQTVKKCLIRNAKSRPSVDELISEYEQFCKV
ncbi:hypothetical protein WA026_017292 [Henosepilachna vigintioctopunctata]|uniref:Protein kinase domain-containing protein n=1 Tax=Henosepilachna vigintioctopunctata TaxID=420089 RepID=A0AAW1UQK7_9CUCU